MMTMGQGQGSQGLVQVMAAAALWATVGFASHLIPAEHNLSEDLLGMARMALGGPVILLVAGAIGQISLAAFRRLAPLRLTGFALGCIVFQVCLFRAFNSLGVTATVFLTVCLPPVLSCGWSWLRGQQVLSTGAGLALALALGGLLVFALGTGQDATGPDAALGLALALLASVAFVVTTCCARDLTRSAGPLIVAGAGLTLAGFGLLVALVVVDAQSVALPHGEPWRVLTLVAYLALGPTALAYVIYCAGMARCRSASAGLVASMIEPGLAALLGWAILGESLSVYQALGCALVTAAMFTLWGTERRTRAD